MSLLTAGRFPHRATVLRRVRAVDDLVGNLDTVVTVSSNVPCWKQIARESEVVAYQKRGFNVTDKIYFLTDILLTEEHLLLINGEVFEVRSRARPDASAGLGWVYRVMAEISTVGMTDLPSGGTYTPSGAISALTIQFEDDSVVQFEDASNVEWGV